MTENNAGPDQTTASLFPLPDPITEPVRCEVTPFPKKRGLKGEAIPGQLNLWGFVSHSVKGVDKTYQWGGAKMYHQRGHWPA